MSHRYVPTNHPTAACVEFMRRTLGEDLDNIRNGDPLRRAEWKTVAADMDTPFPSAEEIAAEAGGDWILEAEQQVLNANGNQVASYYRDKYEECPVCSYPDMTSVR